MESVWVIASESGIVRRKLGWFSTEEDCEKKCEELRQLKNGWYEAIELHKAN
jgi:hypothetical protein